MHNLTKCLNCASNIEHEDKFCYHCGQSTATHPRITMSHIGHEVFHALTHADKGFLFLIKELATQPGETIKQYLSGKHKKFFNPFSFFFIMLGFVVISNTFFKPFYSAVKVTGIDEKGAVTHFPSSIKTEKQKAKFLKVQARLRKAMDFMNTRTNIVLCISTPFLALMMFILYRKQMYYAEHLLVMTFVNTFLNLLSIFIFTPLMHFTGGTLLYKFVVGFMLITHIAYIAIVYHSLIGMPYNAKGVFKSIGTAVFGMIGWMILSFVCIFGYIAFGSFFFK